MFISVREIVLMRVRRENNGYHSPTSPFSLFELMTMIITQRDITGLLLKQYFCFGLKIHSSARTLVTSCTRLWARSTSPVASWSLCTSGFTTRPGPERDDPRRTKSRGNCPRPKSNSWNNTNSNRDVSVNKKSRHNNNNNKKKNWK